MRTTGVDRTEICAVGFDDRVGYLAVEVWPKASGCSERSAHRSGQLEARS